MTKKILVIDEGTTSTRSILFSKSGRAQASSQRELKQYYPERGLVEHDAAEIWKATLATAKDMVKKAGGAEKIAAIGITNQRETVVFWDKRTGEPLAPAIVWQDRRTSEICNKLRDDGHEKLVQKKSGLILDPYFSGSKIGWALKNWPELKKAGDNLAVGTVESYLIYRLTGGLHVTDASNASRTQLMRIDGQHGWDDELCDLFGVPKKILPEIVGCTQNIGETSAELFGAPIPICGMAGDQQAATIGQGCLNKGQTKATFGTGAFILTATEDQLPISTHRLLSTILVQDGDQRCYAMEGSVFAAGSLIKWLRDGLGLLSNAAESEGLARSIPDNGGVYLVPALSGLGAPHWRPDAQGAISGLSFSTSKAHVARAALESMAYQVNDLKNAFEADGIKWGELRIDGGMSANDWMAQDLADILAITVERPDVVESTGLGAAMLAATGAGLYDSLPEAVQAMRGDTSRFTPDIDAKVRKARLAGWQNALQHILN